MTTDFEQRTNEFIELFYEGEGKAPPYLSKQGSELRKTIRNWKPGVKRTPLQKTYEMWSGPNAAPPMAIPELPLVQQVHPDVELVAKAERFKRQRDNMEKKLNAAKIDISDLQDSRAHILENLDIFKADYRIWNPLFGNQFLEHLRLRQTLALGTTQGAT
jgi:hypothetical protein